ncbi:hypothetical protein [Sediminimonas sp.]|uniref:hypothetical protein n=1 Tax=Sediminimonas sp. TaxID=2823379 RepID=UPI0025EBE884|nr:hypothetical protein [Sediminimonas sp.]
MHLVEYVSQFPDRKQEEWGRLFGISRTHFIHLCAGRRNPSHGLMEVIRDKTGGAVPPQSWFEETPDAPPMAVPEPETEQEYVEP